MLSKNQVIEIADLFFNGNPEKAYTLVSDMQEIILSIQGNSFSKDKDTIVNLRNLDYKENFYVCILSSYIFEKCGKPRLYNSFSRFARLYFMRK